jgi:hypothetical protein
MNVKVSRILHAGYLFESECIKIAFDPIFENPFSSNCYAFPNVQFDLEEVKKLNFSAVFISHFHDDHCSLKSLNYLNRDIPIYIYCLHSELVNLIRSLGFKVYSLDINQTVKVGPFRVTTLKALDFEIDSMFQIQVNNLNILNVVDSWIDGQTLELLKTHSPWDLVLWPFQTLREIEVLSPQRAKMATVELPEKWKKQLQCLNPKNLIPSSCQFIHESWSWYNRALFPMTYKKFHFEVNSILPHANILKLNPGASLVLDKTRFHHAEPLSWVHLIDTQDVDYEFDVNLQIPKTEEIAKKFPELTAKQTSRVYKYLQEDIVDQFNLIGSSGHKYFNRPRIWKLSIYNHLGEGSNFFYSLNDNAIEPIETPDTFEWLTEISSFKLYRALEFGESLTSVYIRINDTSFSPELEKEINMVDVLEDPLVRCLYGENTFSFQKSQLKEIL